MTAGALTDRVALVTGSSRGIGLAVAQELADQGAAVIVNGRDPAVVEAAVATLRPRARGVAGVSGSAADPDVIAAMIDRAGVWGAPDVLVTCAGTAEPPGSSILDLELDQWRDLIDAHLTSTFVACRAVAPLLVEQGGGAIVTTSSHAFTGVFGGTGYPAGKGGVNSLTYALAAELREHGIRVNAVCPGARTRLSTGVDYEATIDGLHERGLLDAAMREGALDPAPPAYVARLYAFLASDLAAHLTGQVFAGSGGYLGRFAAPEEHLVGYRDHATSPPWTLLEIAEHFAPRTT